MAKNRVPWTEQEDMMATSYENIAGSFAYISKFMQSLVKTVKNGGGIVTNEDLEEALNMLKDMINKNLYNVSEVRVDISTGIIKPKPASSSTPKSPSPWTSSSSDGNNYQYESKSNKYMKRTINEAQLRDIVRESVKRVLNEIGDTPAGLGLVAQNMDRRKTQMDNTYNNPASKPLERLRSLGNAVGARTYLWQAMRNALASGMSEQEIEQILKQNMSQNYNPTINNGTVQWNEH